MKKRRIGIVVVALMVACGKGSSGGAGASSSAEGTPSPSAVAVSAPPSSAAPPPIPAWATALVSKNFAFASPQGDPVSIQGTLSFTSEPPRWSKDGTFVWLFAVDDVRHNEADNIWIDAKAVVGGFDGKCEVRSEADPDSNSPKSPITGHKAKLSVGCPRGDVTEIAFQNGLPLILKRDAVSGAWSTK